jgi:dTDP-glucose 4,6-dehydratase
MSDESEPTNIGNPNEMTVLQFAEAIKKIVGNDSPIIHKPLPVDDPKIRRPDITKARTKLHWEPQIPLQEGLRRTIDFFRGVVQREDARV